MPDPAFSAREITEGECTGQWIGHWSDGVHTITKKADSPEELTETMNREISSHFQGKPNA